MVPPGQLGPPFWRTDVVGRNVLFSSYHLSSKNARDYVEQLRAMCPAEIIGYPSSLASLAQFMLDQDLPPVRPRCVFTTAETLLSHQRRQIEQAFGTTVTDQYGCTEMSMFVAQCAVGQYHVHPEHGMLEVLDEHGAPAKPGEVGEVVCTGFVNYAMPLLRYRVGDLAAMSPGACSCGLPFPVLAQIVGRADDVIRTADGRLVGRLDPVFKGLSGIRESRIVQHTLQRIDVHLVVDGGFGPPEESALRSALAERLGAVHLQFHYETSLARDASGKFRAVVSHVTNPRGTELETCVD